MAELKGIRDPKERIPRHWEETIFLRRLIADLILKDEHPELTEPITQERLEKARECIKKIEECTTVIEIKY